MYFFTNSFTVFTPDFLFSRNTKLTSWIHFWVSLNDIQSRHEVIRSRKFRKSNFVFFLLSFLFEKMLLRHWTSDSASPLGACSLSFQSRDFFFFKFLCSIAVKMLSYERCLIEAELAIGFEVSSDALVLKILCELSLHRENGICFFFVFFSLTSSF